MVTGYDGNGLLSLAPMLLHNSTLSSSFPYTRERYRTRLCTLYFDKKQYKIDQK
jgi:hypothetical protein